MITKEDLESYAKSKGFKDLGHAEKDYFQNIVLFILSKNYGKSLIFKGGTALNKCFGLDRFSEDLDFTCDGWVESNELEDGLKRFKIEFEIEKKNYSNGIQWVLRIKGPLYIGIKNSMCKIVFDLSLREKIILRPEIKTIGVLIEQIPSFDVLVMQEKEIFAEKIRTIMTRDKARDVYDLNFLINKKISFDKKLAEEKLNFYNKKWSLKEFKSKLNRKKEIWETELKLLTERVPNFNETKKNILNNIK